MADTNGLVRASSLVTTVLPLVAALLSVGYVAFQSQASTSAIAVLERKVEELQRTSIAQSVGLNEIETQFCAQDIVRNLMHANDQRQLAVVYEKVFGARWPTDNAVYPTICNRKAKQ